MLKFPRERAADVLAEGGQETKVSFQGSYVFSPSSPGGPVAWRTKYRHKEHLNRVPLKNTLGTSSCYFLPHVYSWLNKTALVLRAAAFDGGQGCALGLHCFLLFRSLPQNNKKQPGRAKGISYENVRGRINLNNEMGTPLQAKTGELL